MPIYLDRCAACGHEAEDIRSLTAPAPEHCGQSMRKAPATVGVIAHTTAGGNLIHSNTTGMGTKGNRKPKTIGRGHGLGGRRKNPSIKQAIAAGATVRGAPAKGLPKS